MTVNQSGSDYIVDQLLGLGSVMEDNLHVHEGTVTTYIPTKKLEDAQSLDGIDLRVLEEHEYEYLIAAEPK